MIYFYEIESLLVLCSREREGGEGEKEIEIWKEAGIPTIAQKII